MSYVSAQRSHPARGTRPLTRCPAKNLLPLTTSGQEEETLAAPLPIAALEEVALCVLQIVRMIANYPAEVRTEFVPEANYKILRVFVNQQDLGFVIGRKGRTARSLRVLLAAFVGRLGLRVTLNIQGTGI